MEEGLPMLRFLCGANFETAVDKRAWRQICGIEICSIPYHPFLQVFLTCLPRIKVFNDLAAKLSTSVSGEAFNETLRQIRETNLELEECEDS